MQSRPATVDLLASGRALQPLHVWTEILCAGVSCTAAGFLASCLLRADSRVLCPEAGSLLPLLYGTLRHALTTRAAVLVSMLCRLCSAPCPASASWPPPLKRQRQALALGAGQRVRPALGGRAVLARGGLAPELLRHTGRPALELRQVGVVHQPRPRLAGLNVRHLRRYLLKVLLHWGLMLAPCIHSIFEVKHRSW